MFDKQMKMMGSKSGGGKKPSKPAPEAEGKARPEPKEGKVGGEKGDMGEHAGGEASQTVITHHPDGSHEVDGEHHPTHLHALAAIGHKLTGDKHHVAHHDGMQIHTHGINENGEHQEGGSHNSAEEAAQAMHQFLSEEAQEPEHQHPAVAGMGGMGGYGS